MFNDNKLNRGIGVPQFNVPTRPPIENRLIVRELKSKLESVPDNLEVFINGNPITKIKSICIDYDKKSACINLKTEEATTNE